MLISMTRYIVTPKIYWSAIKLAELPDTRTSIGSASDIDTVSLILTVFFSRYIFIMDEVMYRDAYKRLATPLAVCIAIYDCTQ